MTKKQVAEQLPLKTPRGKRPRPDFGCKKPTTKSVSSRMKSQHLTLSAHYNWFEEETLLPKGVQGLSRHEFTSRFELGQVIGTGRTSIVRLATEKATGDVLACKIVNRGKISSKERLRDEIRILSVVSHEHIVSLRHVVETEQEVLFLLDLAAGGDLYERLICKRFEEHEVRQIAASLLRAVGHLHSCSIIHRDIKPENILLVSKDSDVHVKLSDFGLAKICSSDGQLEKRTSELPAVYETGVMGCSPFSQASCESEDCVMQSMDGDSPGSREFSRARAYTSCGTESYVAPEILTGKGYGTQVDAWSIGVVLYILLGGSPPFAREGDDMQTTFRRVMSGDLTFDASRWGTVSPQAKELISGLLVADPEQRLSCAEALGHPWFACT